LKTRSRLENEKPGNEKLNSRFTLKSPLLNRPFQFKMALAYESESSNFTENLGIC
jgi:hypothetical protein